MGRKTFESFPDKFRPLPNRRNIVLTRDKTWVASGAESFESLNDFLGTLDPRGSRVEVWVIGGGEIYRQFIDKADELHITHVESNFDADTFFPTIDKSIWAKVSEEKHEADEKNSHPTVYTIYEKRT
jgi:dihydrofolate reductase